ncbi:hypothetical protein GCM10010517_35210 [Streptosporangium fragile]|uniref:Uncharacterized protein n=1 Tax=Streptosporangium fragile TaxID=46186 RepID=A0ABP6IFS2_9ACTN
MGGEEVARLRALRAAAIGAGREPEWRRTLLDALLSRCADQDVPGATSRADLDEAAEHAAWLLARDCDRESFSSVGRVHEIRWELFGDPADRDVAITMLSEADDLRAEDGWFSTADHAALAELLLGRHADRGLPYDLDAAIDRLRAALDGCDDRVSGLYLRYRLGMALAVRSAGPRAGAADLGEAADVLGGVLPELPAGDPVAHETAVVLGRLLRTRGPAGHRAASRKPPAAWVLALARACASAARARCPGGGARLRGVARHPTRAAGWTAPGDPLRPPVKADRPEREAGPAR